MAAKLSQNFRAAIGQDRTLTFTVLDSAGVAVSGITVYVADGPSGGLRVVDVSDPNSPTEVGSYDTPGWANDVAVAGTIVYVADWNSGLRVVDVSNPTSPTEVGSYDTPGNAQGVAVAGTTAYIADGYGGLRVVDVSNPSSLTEVDWDLSGGGPCRGSGWSIGAAQGGVGCVAGSLSACYLNL